MGRRLSIAMLSHLSSPSAPTGAERSLALLAAGLAGRGHRVTLFAPGPWILGRQLEARGVGVRNLGCRACWWAYHDPRPWPDALARRLRCGWPDPRRRPLSRALAAGSYDVAHVNCLPALGAARAARAAGLPLVWHLREILPPGARRRWWGARLGELADRVVAVSHAVGRWVAEEGLAGRLRVVHNGVAPASAPDRDAARRELGLPATGAVIGLFGQLLPHKGVFEFVRAATLAARDAADATFVLAGPAPEGLVERLRREAAATPGERIRVLPPQPSTASLYAAADAICLASTSPDPLPRAVLEAMAAGLPVVAFRSGGTEEMVQEGETGLLFDVGDVEGLAAGFRRLIADPALRGSMGRAARRRAESEFTVDRHVQRMESLLEEIARR